MRRSMLAAISAGAGVAALIAAPQAQADGLPVVNIDAGGSGVALPSSDERFVAVPAGEDTLLAKTSQEDGSVLKSVEVNGDLTVPAVAYDGSSAGLSSDGSTLVLIEPRPSFPRAHTTFAVFDAQKLNPRQRITLPGDYSFDALSPDGSVLYLIKYQNPRDPAQYAVMAYDLARNELVPDAIVDPDEPNEQMAGLPQTRLTSPNGKIEYTLYDGSDGEPFVHALDTQRGTAACIDLPQLTNVTGRLGLEPASGDGTLVVTRKGKPELQIDPHGYAVSAFEPPAPPAAADDGGGGLPLVLVALAAAGGLGAFALLRLRRRDPEPVTDEELAELVDVEAEAEEPEDAVTR